MKQRQIRRRRAHAAHSTKDRERHERRRYYAGVQWTKQEIKAIRRGVRLPLAKFNRIVPWVPLTYGVDLAGGPDRTVVYCVDCGDVLPAPECWCGGEVCPPGAYLAPVTKAIEDSIRTGLGIIEMQVGRLDSGITFIETDGTKVWVP